MFDRVDLQRESLFTLTLFLFRRTIKDTITFIPVVIILLIPLSPIGHVLVFGAIQRVFPDFFPSCFTERRQNLLGECVYCMYCMKALCGPFLL